MDRCAYVRQIKRLLKVYHPDTRDVEPEAEERCDEVVRALNATLDRLKGGGKSADTAYEYYKQGYTWYKNIHPDVFFRRSGESAYETKTRDEQMCLLDKVFVSFHLARHYFSRVTRDFPDSRWAVDAREKLVLLEKLEKSYEESGIAAPKTVNCAPFVAQMGLKLC